MKPTLIAIDGPTASGKSSLGQSLAQRLGYRFLDTGAMYRAVSWLALKRGIDPEDDAALSRRAAEANMELLPSTPASSDPHLLIVDGEDITHQLRRPEVEAQVSLVSKIQGVREALVEQQRRLARGGRMVMAGRDIGTVVLPQADLKIYLDASPQVRAERRYRELKEEGGEANLEQVLAELTRRDHLDSERALAPLRPADDAVIIQTDDLTLEQVVAKVLALTEDD